MTESACDGSHRHTGGEKLSRHRVSHSLDRDACKSQVLLEPSEGKHPFAGIGGC